MLIEEDAGENNKDNQDTSNSVNILLYFFLVCFQCIFVFIVEVIWNIHFLFCFVHVLGVYSHVVPDPTSIFQYVCTMLFLTLPLVLDVFVVAFLS